MPQTLRREAPKTEPKVKAPDPESLEYPLPPEEPSGPRVSAILVAYNRAPALRRAIQALERSHEREGLEILGIDNGSEDGSPELDVEFPGVTLLRLPHHFGATKAMNIAARTAKCEILFFLSPDVEVSPETVVKLADLLDSETDAVAVCPLLVDAEGHPVSKFQEIPTREAFATVCRGGEPPSLKVDFAEDSIAVEYPGMDALMIRKQFIKGMNYFDERYGHFWADADLAMQVKHAQKKIRIYPRIRAVYRPEPDPFANDTAFTADRALGAAHFLGKYNGFLSGLGFRISSILGALGRMDFRLLSSLVSGQKLDGSQAG